MLTTDEQLRSTQAALAEVEQILAGLRREKSSMHPDWYQVMAGPAADMVLTLRRKIDAYIGLDDPLLREGAADGHAGDLVNGAASAPAPTPSMK